MSPGLSQTNAGTASRAAQATVEGSLLKSRLVTNRWLNQVSKKKKELEEKMFHIGDLQSAMPYSEYSITAKDGRFQNTAPS